MWVRMRGANKVLNMIKENGVSWVELHFTDLIGRLRITHVPSRYIDEDVFKDGIPKLDGSSVDGFGKIEFSDLNLLPDPDTFTILPWDFPNDGKVGRLFTYILKPFKKGALETDPRRIAYLLNNYLESMGLRACIGPEVEFYIFRNIEIDFDNPSSGAGYRLHTIISPWNKDGYPIDYKGGYYSSTHLDKVYSYRYDLAYVLTNYFNVEVVSHHHEVGAASQVEINFLHGDPLVTSDNYMTVKYVARKVGENYGYYITFMPKPIYADNGSGLHTHISIWRNDENLFYDGSDDYAELSQYARYFIGGLIEHGRSLSAFVSPTVNSYKRLVPGYEAPIYLTWSRGNRSAAIRVPVYRKGDIKRKRVEYRPPDPSMNPYLGFSAIILAGLDGVKKKIEPGDPIDKDIYHMSDRERKEYGIKSLPRDLYEALEELMSDNEYLKPIFSSALINTYIDIKMREFKSISSYPTVAEVKHYFSL
jgi:glutamine synthetase